MFNITVLEINSLFPPTLSLSLSLSEFLVKNQVLFSDSTYILKNQQLWNR